MSLSNKIFYFVMGVLFAASIGWNLYRPVQAVAPTTVERKVDVLSDREIDRVTHDIGDLEKSIQDDKDFLAGNVLPRGGKGAWTTQYAEKKNSIEQNLPAKEKQLATLRDMMRTLRM